MKDNPTYYTDLITRYFSGEITEEGLRLLSGWLKTNPQNEELFRQMGKTWQLIEKQKINSSLQVDREWDAMQLKIDSTGGNKTPVKTIPFYQNKGGIKSSFPKIWKVAAAITILLVSSFLLYFYFSKPADIVLLAQSKNLEQVLPDGTVVTLHAGSQISFPEKFTASVRNVKLEGEAYFNVAHDKTKPFIVASGGAMVEVLGTQFNVNTHASATTMEVVLTTGKVSVFYKEKPQEKVLLLPGEKAELDVANRQIGKSANSDPNYLSWKTRMIVFDNETLAQVVKTLENVYQTPIELKGQQLSGCRFTASFNDQSLGSVLQVMKETLDLQVKQDGKMVEISGDGCR